MPYIKTSLFGPALFILLCLQEPIGQGQQTPAAAPTIRVTSRLVFLDVTVLDKKGLPVVTGLDKEDFTITEDKKPQRIFSFEAPETHVADASAAENNPSGKAPVTVFVLDLLNSRFEDFAYIRYSVRKYLDAQPTHLTSPAELMVLGNKSLEMVQGYTRSKADLLSALNHIPAELPYKMMNGSFYAERFGQSIDALQQIALQNKGIPGRKNVVWVGHGGPNIYTEALTGPIVDELNSYVHDTTNMLVDARISLFVIYPGLQIRGQGITLTEVEAGADLGDVDPFTGDINFGVFVNETGGNLFYNRNDVDAEIRRSLELGAKYYTLTYQPQEGEPNGKFRRIRVTLRDPNLHVITKTGYFAPDKNAPSDPRQQSMFNIAEAARSTVPFAALEMTVENLVRHPDASTVEFTVVLKPKNIGWQAADNEKSTTNLMVAAVSLSNRRDILASRLESLTISTNTQDASRLATTLTRLPIRIRVPRKTQDVRVAIQVGDSGRIGTVELDRKMIDAAPESPTPDPKLTTSTERKSPDTGPDLK
jgi:VWFA-related protein